MWNRQRWQQAVRAVLDQRNHGLPPSCQRTAPSSPASRRLITWLVRSPAAPARRQRRRILARENRLWQQPRLRGCVASSSCGGKAARRRQCEGQEAPSRCPVIPLCRCVLSHPPTAADVHQTQVGATHWSSGFLSQVSSSTGAEHVSLRTLGRSGENLSSPCWASVGPSPTTRRRGGQEMRASPAHVAGRSSRAAAGTQLLPLPSLCAPTGVHCG